MSLSEEDNLNEEKERQEWRNAFENAADTPPERVWDAIARQLDEQETPPLVPLWKNPAQPRFRNWAYGVAAAVALLLIGWWGMQSIESPSGIPAVADRVATSPNAVANGQAENPQSPETHTPPTDLATTAERSGHSAANQVSESAPFRNSHKGQTDAALAFNSSRISNSKQVAHRRSEAVAIDPARVVAADNYPYTGLRATPAANAVPKGSADERLAYEADYLPTRAIGRQRALAINRIVWYRTPDAIEPQESKRSDRHELWAGLSATPMSFNPVAAVGQRNYVNSFVNNSITQARTSTSTKVVQNEAQLSMAWQANAGLRVSKHWLVETGVQYLNGRSQAKNNASVVSLVASQSENALVNAVRNSSSPASSINPAADNLYMSSGAGVTSSSYTTSIQSSQVVSNNFQYIQVPVQAGYKIRPNRKVNYVILGGVLANVFLQNTIDGTLEVKPADQVYRPVTMAGTAGLRLNYQATAHWSGALTGSFQQALQSGTHSDAQLTTRPQAVGVGVGLNYHF